MMRLVNVSARYDILTGYVEAVDNVNFEVRENEILGIAGESGCGKTTLLKVMYDLIAYPLELSQGRVEIETRNKNGDVEIIKSGEISTAWWKHISYVPQGAMHVLNPVTKIELQFFEAIKKHYKGISKAGLKKMIVDYLAELELDPDVMGSYPHQLSGGMRQRVLIAMATIMSPEIILADEPTTALDVVVQRGILTMLSDVQKLKKNSIVIVSHDMGVHYQITNRLGIMYAGQMIELGNTTDLFERPAHPYTRMLIDALPVIGDLKPREGILGTPPSLKSPPIGCRFAVRCPYAKDMCSKEQPEVIDLGGGHNVMCHLVGKLPFHTVETKEVTA